MARTPKTASVGFEVLRNLRRVCIAGLRGNRGVIAAIVHWTDRDGADEIMLQVGGLDAGTREDLSWTQQPLHIGDELTIRVLDTPVSTRVRSRKSWDERSAEKQEKAWLRKAAKKYGYTLVRPAPALRSRTEQA